MRFSISLFSWTDKQNCIRPQKVRFSFSSSSSCLFPCLQSYYYNRPLVLFCFRLFCFVFLYFFSLVQDGTYALGKAHTRSTPSLSVPDVLHSYSKQFLSRSSPLKTHNWLSVRLRGTIDAHSAKRCRLRHKQWIRLCVRFHDLYAVRPGVTCPADWALNSKTWSINWPVGQPMGQGYKGICSPTTQEFVEIQTRKTECVVPLGPNPFTLARSRTVRPCLYVCVLLGWFGVGFCCRF